MRGTVSDAREHLDALADEPPLRRWAGRVQMLDPWSRASLALEVVIVAGAVVFVLAQLGPGMLSADTTPAGGDMGAHVWGPAYLRDNLLGQGRLSGWSPDWYAGFPAYHFYMVVPALFVVALDAGWSGWAALVPLAAGLGLLGVALTHRSRGVRRVAAAAGIAVVVLGAGMPYGVALKWVTVSGLLALPVCCYVAARLADLPFPGPPIFALGSVVYLFNRQPIENSTGNIIGGNIASTLAGEFSFSISLAFLVLFIGFLLRGLRRGGHRATCAVLLALTALCHVIPAIYGIVATAVALVVSMPLRRARLRWFLPIGPVAAAISAFWTGPFLLRREYLNDMGWEKIPAGINDVPMRDLLWTFWWDDARYGQLRGDLIDTLLPGPIRWILYLAIVGAVVSALARIRIGVLLSACAAITAVLFVVTPQGRLWNARLLPFFMLCLCLLAGLAVSELGRAVATLVSSRPERSVGPVSFATPALAALATIVYVGLALGILPGSERQASGAERWLGLEVSAEERNVVPDWARWNYDGYERKPAYPEYHSLIALMEGVAADPELGCGRAMWEYEDTRLNTYGTPMAPMLLPFWTDGCIGSMEGLYFEASTTTPYHFLNQRALSANCSCAQRDLPYGAGFDIDLGVDQLQLMGVRYYLAFTETAVAAADVHPDLTEVAADEVWHVYLVDDSELVVPLENEPAVLTGLEPGMSWVGPNSKWFQDPARWDVHLAADGPAEWQRVEVAPPPAADKPVNEPVSYSPSWTQLDVVEAPEERPLPAITVSSIESSDDSISFEVSEVGVPVLVKASYFPNWQVSGAEGPYRVSPNLMVVIPTDTSVELTYGWTAVDVGSYGLTGLGIAGAILLARWPRRYDGDDLFLNGPDGRDARDPEPARPPESAADDPDGSVDDGAVPAPP